MNGVSISQAKYKKTQLQIIPVGSGRGGPISGGGRIILPDHPSITQCHVCLELFAKYHFKQTSPDVWLRVCKACEERKLMLEVTPPPSSCPFGPGELNNMNILRCIFYKVTVLYGLCLSSTLLFV